MDIRTYLQTEKKTLKVAFLSQLSRCKTFIKNCTIFPEILFIEGKKSRRICSTLAEVKTGANLLVTC